MHSDAETARRKMRPRSSLRLWAIGIGAVVMAAVPGCRKTDEAESGAPVEPESSSRRAAQSLDVADEFEEAAREGFVRATQKNLDALEQKVEQLAVNADQQGQYEDDKARFDRQKAQAEQQLQDARSADSETWQDAKAAAEAAYDELERTYRQMAEKYR